ncbi:anti-phage defense-associated sirtuin Dsr1 [Deefgea piscis]|uniref:anti-phage defense-associated sirtuin Dsr1 n=1 Tax=Deefgea piscis TaxID=2739061 RepID=UPI001C7F4846|nr:anti-phage defense-associated sirtuin Dsr1 [Deefgea piscis]QZA80172.1 SIR2 family protein [Deefgea piscis]
MQFIENGPDIPDELLQAHEDGRVVFFCGAGISYPAGLPGFGGLVNKIYELIGEDPSEIEAMALKRQQFDSALDLLERRIVGGRLAVRSKLAQVLKPKLRRKGAIDTQSALLRLGRSRGGALRLVTTNFDNLFDVAAKRTSQKFQSYAAPMLPIPKNSRWDGLVYLHGQLPEKADEATLNRLVVTSGDFGLAYLTERWAARFVSELFRNYVVCFVGYSLNDPVLRYMMDALAADRMQGEFTLQAWALGDVEPGQEHRKTIEWCSKGVRPILYKVPVDSYDHSALHLTLHAWANTYRDGVQGKEAIVVKNALARPQESTQQDDFVGRVLWALSDKSGLPAKCFANFNPAPSLDWLLEPFSKDRFGCVDLPRFGVSPSRDLDGKFSFSLIRRPVAYDQAPRMVLASSALLGSQWDDVMRHLAIWLIRHLGDPRLILWIAQGGGRIHHEWRGMIELKLNHLASLEREGNTAELDEIRLNSPQAIPGSLMRTFWHILLSGRLKSKRLGPDLYAWAKRLRQEGLTFTLRLELRELLAPQIMLRESSRWSDDSESVDERTRFKQLVNYDLVLAADHVHLTLSELADNADWTLALPHLLEDFQQLLRDALDLFKALGNTDEHVDRSYLYLPSIAPHKQNQGFDDRASLIELLRDSWLALRVNDCPRATKIALMWFELPYPIFKRLALFAASMEDRILPEQWVDWLLADRAMWLWSTETRREVFRLFVLQGQQLGEFDQNRLESAILLGPDTFRGHLDDGELQKLVAHSIWRHLSKLKASGLNLGKLAAEHLAELSDENPEWQLSINESDEFSYWTGGVDDLSRDDICDDDIAPRKRGELVQWLIKPPKKQWPFGEDTWREVCRKHMLNSLFALCELARDGVWPVERWREALQVWSEKGMVLRSWHYAAPLVSLVPDKQLQDVAHQLTWWMMTVSKSINQHEEILLDLCRRVLTLPLEASTGILINGKPINEPVEEAINHPVGHVTQALINLWFKRKPNDGDLLANEFKSLFTELCDTNIDRFRHGRVLLSSRLIAVFRVDRDWTEQYLLPLFCWTNPVEAKAAWEGFLWSPRIYQPLLIAFKPQFLESASHFADLGKHRQQFAAFLTYTALETPSGFTSEEFRAAIKSLPPEGLEACVQALLQALGGASEQREEYWKNRILPYWQNVWPKSKEFVTPRISELLIRLIVAAGDEFPSAFETLKDWLGPVEYPSYIIRTLFESSLCKQFPEELLFLLDVIIGDLKYLPSELEQCLEHIKQEKPILEKSDNFIRLNDCVRRTL